MFSTCRRSGINFIIFRSCHGEPQQQQQVIRSSHRPTPILDSQIVHRISQGKSFGRGRISCTVPPEEVTQILAKSLARDNAKNQDSKVLGNIEKYIGTGQKIERYLKSRNLPMDSRNRQIYKDKFLWQAKRKYNEELTSALSDENNEDALREIEAKLEEEVESKMASTKGNWKPIHFDHTATWAYLLCGASAFDYACAVHSLKKVFENNKKFVPVSHLDYGSGVGTFSWALKHHFKANHSIKEEFLIDISGDMNDVSRLIRSDGKESTPNNIIHHKGVFYRLHFPANETFKYDLVTCGSSLSELESSELRLNIADSLWRRVEEGGYFVIYERGTNAGFQVLSEIRDYIIQIQAYAEEDPSLKGELVAPCTHSLPCPRYLYDRIPCNFEVKYKNFQLPQFPNEFKEIVYQNRFSYLIFRKGSNHPSTNGQWQRIVKENKRTKNTLICELCTNRGSIEEIFVHKRDKILYQYTKQVNVGDLYKAKLIDKTDK